MVRFGILGAGNIAHRFAASLAHCEHAELVAASCRTARKAEEFLGAVPHNSIARAYGSHAELLEDASVDAIYLALPHDLHFEWALRALRAGKAVMCEKPAMLTAEQMSEVADVATREGVLFMEAMKPRFTPLYAKVAAAVARIGGVSSVDATLCNNMLGFVEGTGTYHMTPGPGAGVLLDCGTYCASWIEDYCPDEPQVRSVRGSRKDGIDIYVDAHMVCGKREARLECAFDRAKKRMAVLTGPLGRIEVDELHRPQRATLYVDGREPEILEAPYVVDDFYGEVCHFAELMEDGALESPVMSLGDSIRCARILDVVREAFDRMQ